MTSVPTGKGGPCCSVAASGRTAIHRAGAPAETSGQWMSVQSRGGSKEVIDRNVFLRGVARSFVFMRKDASQRPIASYHGPERSTESNHEPGYFAASVNSCPGGGSYGHRAGQRPSAGQGLVRNQLGCRGRARRIFPGRGRRHLQEIR